MCVTDLLHVEPVGAEAGRLFERALLVFASQLNSPLLGSMGVEGTLERIEEMLDANCVRIVTTSEQAYMWLQIQIDDGSWYPLPETLDRSDIVAEGWRINWPQEEAG